MAGNQPIAEPMEFSMRWTRPEQFRSEDVTPTPWAQAQSGLERAGTYCLATVNPDGRPHVVPVLAVVVDGVVHFCASDRSRKARNIAADPRCSIATSSFPADEKSVPTRWRF